MTALAPTAVVGGTARRRFLITLGLRLGFVMVVANLVGAALVFLFLGFLLPTSTRTLTANIVAVVGYLGLSVLAGIAVSTVAFQPIRRWVLAGESADDHMRAYVVRHPQRQALINFAMWLGSEFVFVPINARFGAVIDSDVATTILMGAITTCGLTYLLAERILRPVNELVFATGVPTGNYVPGVKSRLMISWALGTGVPMVGVVMMAVDHGDKPISVAGLAFLGCVGLLSGSVAMLFSARSVADPVESVTAALADVEAGRLDVSVPVYDGSQIGELQAGFNAMVDGLRERRQIRDLFGRHVGEHVAQQALERGAQLGGEQVHAAMLFVDVIGSTALAASLPPAKVVAALNEFFAIVIDVVDGTGGWVNKFEGDAALCIFGAPVPLPGADGCALLAARMLRNRLADVRGLSAAIGVSSGEVVAGNVGAKERFEFTVIGDAVNEAARLTELAKARPERLLVSAAMLAGVDDEERRHWTNAGEQVLRGRATPTQLAVCGSAE